MATPSLWSNVQGKWRHVPLEKENQWNLVRAAVRRQLLLYSGILSMTANEVCVQSVTQSSRLRTGFFGGELLGARMCSGYLQTCSRHTCFPWCKHHERSHLIVFLLSFTELKEWRTGGHNSGQHCAVPGREGNEWSWHFWSSSVELGVWK